MIHGEPSFRNTQKRGRPRIEQYRVLSFRMSEEETAALDRWRSTERDKPSRSEAIRWFISEGLFAAELKARAKTLPAQSKSEQESPKTSCVWAGGRECGRCD